MKRRETSRRQVRLDREIERLIDAGKLNRLDREEESEGIVVVAREQEEMKKPGEEDTRRKKEREREMSS